MTRIERLIDRHSFSDWFLIDILEYICSVLDREVRGLKQGVKLEGFLGPHCMLASVPRAA